VSAFAFNDWRLDYIGKGKNMHLKRGLAALLCMAVSCVALPGMAGEILKNAQASMLVTGWIEVMPDGTVHGYTIDHQDKLPPSVLELIHDNVATWKFKVMLKEPVIERARMNLRIVAKRADEQHDSIQIANAFFGDKGTGSDNISFKQQVAPEYPQDAIARRASGTVYVIARVNRQGLVEDAFAEQVNLNGFFDGARTPRDRSLLAHAALDAIKHWTFNLPTTGPHIADEHWDIRIPVQFNLNAFGTSPQDNYGKWQVYVPGPRAQAPWQQQSAPSVQGSDAIPAGSISQADENLSLATPLAGA
jgi:TonB family protein